MAGGDAAMPLTILYIEDNPDNRILVRSVLGAAGYVVLEAEDGFAGLEVAIRERPALILLDIHLPGMNGFEVAAMLKSFPALAATVIVAVTAYATPGDRERILVAGCDGYIQKPIDVDTFPRQIAEFLDGKREQVAEHDAGPYLRELNQQLVYRLLTQLEELKRFNQYFFRRVNQLEDLHRAIQGMRPELPPGPLLETLLPTVARALGTTRLTVELFDPPGVRVEVAGPPAADGTDIEWKLDLTLGGRPSGIMIACQPAAAGAKADEEQLLKLVANQVAFAVENSRLYEETRRRLRETETLLGMLRAANEESEALARIGWELAHTLDLDQVLGLILERALGIAEADLAYIALAQEDGSARSVAFRGPWRSTLEGIFVRPGVDLAGLALATGEMREATAGSGALDATAAAEGMRAVLAAPLALAGRPVGLLWLGRRGAGPFAPEAKHRLRQLTPSLAIALHNARLHREVAEKAVELEGTNSVLADTLRVESEFLSNTSHELRTPLTAILGLLDAILKGLCTGAEEEREFIVQARACAEALQAQINNILDMARIESGKLELQVERVDLAELFEELRRLLQGQVAATPGLRLTFEPPPPGRTIPADRMRLKQVLLNLVNNSLKFTGEGTIAVRALARPEAGFMTISVTDTGIGVPPERQGRLFQKFVQADGSTSRKHGGTGLGLAIGKRLVEMMGGVIALESRGTGCGTTVTLSLPLSRSEASLRPAPDRQGALVQGPNERPLILVVDDDPSFREMLRDFLHDEGFQTVEAGTAQEGLERSVRLRPAVLLTDLALACADSAVVRTGLDLVVALSRKPGFAKQPMILLTGAPLEARLQLRGLPLLTSVHLLEKPVGLDLLRRTITAALRPVPSGIGT